VDSLEVETHRVWWPVTEGTFTPAQLEAITADNGPLGIIAGPGCGKTTVLAGRIAFLIRERGFDPPSILAVSFTTEAARALRAQVGQQLGAAASKRAIRVALPGRISDGSSKASQNHCSSFGSRRTETNATSKLSV